ncbi:MAG: hypothetical protein NC299_12420 [Lachnospiraceae bacterium]|nr:hypothetical protein [Ruminococcus sp.]MCM1276146.1 hypothetical protein [Lachnospiraceae bacterium]
MGAGKTSWAIDYINQHQDESILYIAPYLSETERIQSSVFRDVKLPQQHGDGKIGDILKLLENEEDIASTHALFTKLTDEHKEAIQCGNYTLFIDETIEAVAPYELKNKDDLQYLIDKGSVTINSDGAIEWIDHDYDIGFNPIKVLAKNHALYRVNETILIWQYPPDIFKIFKKIFVLTYMFKSSTMRYYFDLAGIKYNLKSVKQGDDDYQFYQLVDYHEPSIEYFRDKIHIYDKPDLNKIFPQKTTALSKSWFDNSNNKWKMEALQKATYNFFHNKCGSKSNEVMWTTFKKHKNDLKGKGYSNSFVSLNCRATNDYADSKYLAYIVNVFPHVGVAQYFLQHGIKLDDDNYALSTLVQWIFRSAIRNGEDVYIYIPSERMRNLLKRWLNV